MLRWFRKNFLLKACLFIGFCSFIWAKFVEPSLLTVTHVDVPLQEWSGTTNSYTIVLISDLHIKPKQSEKKRIEKIISIIRELSPDRILITGDFCSGATMKSTMPPAQIGELLAPLLDIADTEAVLGNHDHHCKGELMDALKENGIRYLDRETILVNNNGLLLQFSGTSDYTHYPKTSVSAIPKRQSPDIPHILLTHNPDIIPHINKEEVSLTVAGHTHGGQVCLPGGIPIHVPSEYGTKYAYGNMNVNGRRLIVTRGLGTSLLPLRFCCPPEIMVLHLKPADQ